MYGRGTAWGIASRRQVEEANRFERDLFGDSAWRGGAVREETSQGWASA
jgi:hypothetical protein